MSWILKTLSSSLGKKLMMSLTGLFVIVFLLVHLMGNLTMFKDDGGATFNAYAHFMSTNLLIEVISYFLYFFFILHIVVASWITLANQTKRPVGYKKLNASANSTWASRNMYILGLLIFAFLFIHLKDFWWVYKVQHDPLTQYHYSGENRNLYALVVDQFKTTFGLVTYLIGLVALFYHLTHGFESAFETLGWDHKKYTPFIRFLSWLYAIVVPLGFATMPVYFYFFAK